MPNENKSKEDKKSHRGFALKVILIIVYLLILLYLGYLFVEFGSNLLVVITLIVFVFLITISPFFKRKNKRSLYSRMFPDRKKRPRPQRQRKKRRPIIVKNPKQIQPIIFKSVNLEFEYRKPLISNCENCGNILPSFVKSKCPFCGEQI